MKKERGGKKENGNREEGEEAGEKNTNGAREMKDDEPQEDGKEEAPTVKKARNIIFQLALPT